MLTAEELRRELDYDPSIGVFRRKIARPGNAIGMIVGCVNNAGYVSVGINYRRYLAHRLAWLYVHGCWPAAEIDHADGCGTNNRIKNLRLATSSQNKGNSRRRRDNTSGLKGVTFDKARDRWVAQISNRGKYKFLGRFETKAAAHAAYVEAANARFGIFARAN